MVKSEAPKNRTTPHTYKVEVDEAKKKAVESAKVDAYLDYVADITPASEKDKGGKSKKK